MLEGVEAVVQAPKARNNGEKKPEWACPKTSRLKRSGRTRLVSMQEKQHVTEVSRLLVTEARHGESGRVIETWGDRWAAEVVHEFGPQVTGLEAAQVRKEEAVTCHLRVSGVAQSIIHRAPAGESPSARDAFAEGKMTYGQRCRAIGREVMRSLLELMRHLFTVGKSCEE
jgi:hypothetical protein